MQVLPVSGGPAVEIGLPTIGADGASITPEGVSVFQGADDNSLAVHAVEGGGVQAILTLMSVDAPTTYEFDLGVPPGGRIEKLDSGGVAVFDADGTFVGELSPPWAVDAGGQVIETWFDITEGGVSQTIVTSPSTAFPVIADPCWSCWASTAWKVTKCAAAITIAVVSVATFAGWVKKVGGATKAAKILIGATSARAKAIGVAGAVTGLDAVISACS